METIPHLGASRELIASASAKLGVHFPDELMAVWMVSNGLELRGGWRFFPVFDPAEPRKTCNDIVYENTKGRWSYMAENLLAIAVGDTGDCLVLTRERDNFDSQILLWDHETNKTRKWPKSVSYLLEKARARLSKIERQIARSQRSRR